MEDFIDPTTTVALSSVPVQFLVQVVAPYTCTEPPDIIGGSTGDSCISAQINETLSFQLIAKNNCGSSVTIVDIATLPFPGVTKSHLIKSSSKTYYKNFTWTPTATEIGYQVLCAMAVDRSMSFKN